MWLIDAILGRKADRKPSPAAVAVRAKFDAASDSPDNRRHWSQADGLSADAALSPAVRKRLRERSRYEAANNSYAKGIILTLANDVVGTGPRLQLRTEDAEANRRIEDAFDAWATEIRLAEKLRCMRSARAESGECFAMLVQNGNLSSDVKLDIRLIEADQVAVPSGFAVSGTIDGIEFDMFGNAVAYNVLRAHPGSGSAQASQWDRVPASSMLHYYRADRPGQSRGIPDITAALPLFAQLRRYTLAVITAAESVANIAGTIETDAPANGEADQVEPLDLVELDRNSLLTMPAGWKMKQVQAEQPTTTYGDFKREIINEIARCLNMPFNVAACNSSTYNYSSGRLDHQTYYRSIRIDQQHLADTVLDRVFRAWLDEAILVSGLIPPQMRMSEWAHEWFWPGQEHVDPLKEANAAMTRLETSTTTLAAEFARQGKDWEAELRQRARELALMRELGLPLSTSMNLQPVIDQQDGADDGN